MIPVDGGRVERDLGRAHGRVRRASGAASTPSRSRARLAHGIDDLGARLVRWRSPPEFRARAAAPHAIGATAGEHEPAVARVDVEPMHVGREWRFARGLAACVASPDCVAADEARREHGVRVCSHVSGAVGESGLPQVAREPRGERDGADGEDHRGREEECSQQRQGTPEAGRSGIRDMRRMQACIGPHKDDFERPSTIGRRGARRRLPRDVRLHAHGEARAERDAGAAWRRPPPRSIARRARSGSSCAATSASSSSRRSSSRTTTPTTTSACPGC